MSLDKQWLPTWEQHLFIQIFDDIFFHHWANDKPLCLVVRNTSGLCYMMSDNANVHSHICTVEQLPFSGKQIYKQAKGYFFFQDSGHFCFYIADFPNLFTQNFPVLHCLKIKSHFWKNEIQVHVPSFSENEIFPFQTIKSHFLKNKSHTSENKTPHTL